jgi:phosphoglycerate dehydrogenase-like enzyme
MTFRIAVLDDYQVVAAGMADWQSLGPDVRVTFFHDHVSDEDQLAQRLEIFDAIVPMRERTALRGTLIKRLPNLRLIVTFGPFNAAIDVQAANESGVIVCGTTAWQGKAGTKELTWGLILALVRGLPREDAAMRYGAWQVGLGDLLAGKTLGLVGLGNLGALMAPIARAFDMEVVAWSRNLSDDRAQQVGVKRLDRVEFFSTSDVISVHLKLSDRSYGYVGRDELALMKASAYLVNTSRGPVVDEQALIDALRSKRIAGAALDVFDSEPLPSDHPFRSLPNTVLSPHIGYATTDSYRVNFALVVEDLRAFLEGSPIRVIEASD